MDQGEPRCARDCMPRFSEVNGLKVSMALTGRLGLPAEMPGKVHLERPDFAFIRWRAARSHGLGVRPGPALGFFWGPTRGRPMVDPHLSEGTRSNHRSLRILVSAEGIEPSTY